MVSLLEIPFDLLEPILSQLTDQRSRHACCLVSHNFNKVATPFLYRSLDSRIISGSKITISKKSKYSSDSILYHPATTLLSHPELALHVRHVTETGGVHCSLSRLPRYSDITQDTLRALALCKNLRSFTWLDDTGYGHVLGTDEPHGAGRFLLGFISLAHTTPLPLRSLTLRTHLDLGSEVWDSLNTLTNLTRVRIWSMEGPPRVLQNWSTNLGSSLKELELGRCAGVPPTILITVVSDLPLLTSLRIKGVPSSAILMILPYVKELRELDVEYLHSNGKVRQWIEDMPALRTLTVRTSSNADHSDTPKMWDWIRQLVGKKGLEVFKLHAFSLYNHSNSPSPRSRNTNRPSSASSSSASPYSSAYTYSHTPSSAGSASYFPSMTSASGHQYSAYTPSSYLFSPSFHTRDLGQTMIPRSFILDLARLHSQSLTTFAAAEAGVLTLWDVECLCGVFPQLEVLECAVSVEVGWSGSAGSTKGDIDEQETDKKGGRGVTSIKNAIGAAKNLTTLKLNIQWLPSPSLSLDHDHKDEHDYGSDFDSDSDSSSSVDSSSSPRYKNASGFPSRHVNMNGNGNNRKHTPDRDLSRKFHHLKKPSAAQDDETEPDSSHFTLDDARTLMLRTPESVLRTVGVGGVVYQGQWKLSKSTSSTTEEELPSKSGSVNTPRPNSSTEGTDTEGAKTGIWVGIGHRAESEFESDLVFVVLTNVES